MDSAPLATPPNYQPSQPQAPQPAEPPKKVKDKKTGNNPVIAISIAILLALILSGLSLASFLRSDTYKTVKLIQKPSTSDSTDSTIDTTSQLKPADLEAIQAAAIKDLDGLNDAADFSPNELTDAALGL